MMLNYSQVMTPAHAARQGQRLAARRSLDTIYEDEMARCSPAHRRSASSPSPMSILGALSTYDSAHVDSYESKLVEMMTGGPATRAALPSRLSRFCQFVMQGLCGLISACTAGAASTDGPEDFDEVSPTSEASPKDLLYEAGERVSTLPLACTPLPLSARSERGTLVGVSTGSMQAPGSAPAEVGASRLRIDQERKSSGGALSSNEGVSVLDALSESCAGTSREGSDCGDAAAADVSALEVAPVVHCLKTFDVRDVCLEMVSRLTASHVARTAHTVWAGMAKATLFGA
ncbi:hypothetical protein FOA52_002441 [Chlamydomonas sp. UWO 241]|nr:hypothetical protein FOA52_002441 [Chlamydomonas sp. UWO 241]